MPESSAIWPNAADTGPERRRIRRRSRQLGRAQRWDARPVLTARDASALRFIGEQYAVRDDVLAVLLGRLSPRGRAEARPAGGPHRPPAGRAVGGCRLGRAPPAARAHLGSADPGCGSPGWSWTPGRQLSTAWPTTTPPRSSAWRELVPGGGGWVCERELWRRRGRASWHMADGALPAAVPAGWQGIDQAWELVEVELTRKARPRLVAALKTRPPHTAAISYYVPVALHAPLSALLAGVVRELGGHPPVAVEPLPQVPGVTYLTAGGDG